jgi:hypothetical protein
MPVAVLPRLYDEAATDGAVKTVRNSDAASFVKTVTAYGGDRHVGAPAWWTLLPRSDLFAPLDATHAVFVGKAIDPSTGRPTDDRVVGGMDLHNRSGRWVRRLGNAKSHRRRPSRCAGRNDRAGRDPAQHRPRRSPGCRSDLRDRRFDRSDSLG